MRGLEVAKGCEARVCEGLCRVGRLNSYCERRKGAVAGKEYGRKFRHGGQRGEEELCSLSQEDAENLEAAEALFAYFCEKNVLPMLIDSLLCHPPPLTSSSSMDGSDTTNLDNKNNPSSNNTTTISSTPSPFSGVSGHPPSKPKYSKPSPTLTYLLLSNYMNELIMGMLPLDQWKGDSLEEILPPYVTLFRGLVMRVRGEEGGGCLPLFLCQRPKRRLHRSKAVQGELADATASTETYLPYRICLKSALITWKDRSRKRWKIPGVIFSRPDSMCLLHTQ